MMMEATNKMEATDSSTMSRTIIEYPPQYMQMMRAAVRRGDIKALMNMPDPDEWSRQQKEQAEAQNSPVKKSRWRKQSRTKTQRCRPKNDKHLLVIRLKKDTEKKEDPSKTKSHKLKVLKMFFKSRPEDDIKCLRKKYWDGKGTLKRNVHIMDQDTVRIDFTIQIEVKQWTDSTINWIMQTAEGDGKTMKPAKQRRATKVGISSPEGKEKAGAVPHHKNLE